MSRNAQRQAFSDHDRITLLELDQDEQDRENVKLRAAISEVQDTFKKFAWWALGIIASICTSAVLFAVNLVVTR
jgi:recombinational DNA repair protein RecT